MTIAGMTERLKTLDVYQIAFDILYTYQFELEAVQKSQLWAGRDLKGALLSPTLY
ncbi:MAG: hypothetical protein LBD91_02070 [Prevotellaceae bacterium]|jgi:hypothetical protein|nr:hypothetical protein [Prevotellaceae bacterium]